eukprot:symbB.v1.2.039356.t1/scaffold6509.1/size17500/1
MKVAGQREDLVLFCCHFEEGIATVSATPMGSAAGCAKSNGTESLHLQDSEDESGIPFGRGQELSAERSWTLPGKPWIYQRVTAYDAKEWAARFGESSPQGEPLLDVSSNILRPIPLDLGPVSLCTGNTFIDVSVVSWRAACCELFFLRTVTPTRPVVIRVDAPPAPAPATPTHPWLSPEQNWEEDPWTRAEREHAEQQEARAAAKAPPPPAPSATPEPTPPVTPSINPPRQHSQHRVEETPINRAFETLRHTAGSTIHSIPASMPAPSSDSGPYDLTQVATRADTNPMTQSWNLISGFPATPSPPRIPDTILGAWFERPPIQFTRQLPPTHIQGMPSLLRADSTFQLNSQLLTEFTSLLENHYPVSMGTWGTIIHGNMTPQVPGRQHFDRLQLIPMASETSTADASLLKFWWHQHLLIARNVAQERFANSSAGPTIISDHLQAFLLTAINLMRLARPVGPPFELRQPYLKPSRVP